MAIHPHTNEFYVAHDSADRLEVFSGVRYSSTSAITPARDVDKPAFQQASTCCTLLLWSRLPERAPSMKRYQFRHDNSPRRIDYVLLF